MRQLRRRSIISAVAQVVSEHGVQSTTASRIIDTACVPSEVFYEHFDSHEDCLRSTFDEFVALAGETVSLAVVHEHRWVDRMRVGLLALLDLLEAEREWALLATTLALAPTAPLVDSRNLLFARLTSLVDAGRQQSRSMARLPAVTAEGIVGGVLAVLGARLRERHPRPLVELAEPLLGFVVLPYLGPVAARREMGRTAVAASLHARRGRQARLRVRLTYRTVLVLSAIARRPQSSNRELAQAVGIQDEGQISKLLTRIERHELARNNGPGQPGGGRNSWTLTARGEELRRTTRGMLVGVDEGRFPAGGASGIQLPAS